MDNNTKKTQFQTYFCIADISVNNNYSYFITSNRLGFTFGTSISVNRSLIISSNIGTSSAINFGKFTSFSISIVIRVSSNAENRFLLYLLYKKANN